MTVNARITVSMYLCRRIQPSLLTPHFSPANCIFAAVNKTVELNMSLVYCVIQSSFHDPVIPFQTKRALSDSPTQLITCLR